MVASYIPAGRMLGRIASQLFDGQARSVKISYQGEVSTLKTDPIKAALLGGLMEGLIEERINVVNMDFIISSRGLRLTEERESVCENYSNLLTIQVEGDLGRTIVSASVLRERAYLIRLNDFWMEIEPAGDYMLFTEHKDRPGMIGAVGTILGNADVNISQMQVSRGLERGGRAMMALCLDDQLKPEVHKRLLSIPDMHSLHVVRIGRQP